MVWKIVDNRVDWCGAESLHEQSSQAGVDCNSVALTILLLVVLFDPPQAHILLLITTTPLYNFPTRNPRVLHHTTTFGKLLKRPIRIVLLYGLCLPPFFLCVRHWRAIGLPDIRWPCRMPISTLLRSGHLLLLLFLFLVLILLIFKVACV